MTVPLVQAILLKMVSIFLKKKKMVHYTLY